MKYKILHFVPGFDHGGIESRLIDWYSQIDKEKFQFDLLKLNSSKDSKFIDEFKALGGNVYTLPKFSLKNYFHFRTKLKEFFKTNNYHVLHCHSPITGKYVLEQAKKSKIPLRILHSRTVQFDPNSSFLLYRKYLKTMSVAYSNKYFACSKEAGDWMFGKGSSFNIIKNGIVSNKFIFCSKTRNKIRKDFKCTDDIVIGNVSRFTPSKNHKFLLDILQEVCSRGYNAKLMMLGDGPTQSEIIKEAQVKGLSNNIILLGARENVEEFYQAMDIFVFPSEYEGFGTVAIEAQAAGLKTIASDRVPNTVDVTDLVTHLPLELGIEPWVDKILKNINYKRSNRKLEIVNSGYDVSTTIEVLDRIYTEVGKE